MTGWAVWIHGIRPVSDLVEVAREAEEQGAAALLIADELTERDIYVTLTAIAAATERIALVPAITNPHTRHPIATAVALATLEEVAPGRVVAGLGVGGNLIFGPLGRVPARPFTALAETVEVVDRLLGGELVDHEGEFTVSHTEIPWSPGPLPIAVAGRGPRVRGLAADRADWVILAGHPIESAARLTHELRARAAGSGRDPLIVWNPSLAWRPQDIDTLRGLYAFITVDLPAHERQELGLTDEFVDSLQTEVHWRGHEAAARLVPDAVLTRYSLSGPRDHVIGRLADEVERVRPGIVTFQTFEYTRAFVAEIAALATEAGLSCAADGALTGSL
jgi:5,10-methylenetetrahydromethanopterin reductase